MSSTSNIVALHTVLEDHFFVLLRILASFVIYMNICAYTHCSLRATQTKNSGREQMSEVFI